MKTGGTPPSLSSAAGGARYPSDRFEDDEGSVVARIAAIAASNGPMARVRGRTCYTVGQAAPLEGRRRDVLHDDELPHALTAIGQIPCIGPGDAIA
jgi:hypothetical protein